MATFSPLSVAGYAELKRNIGDGGGYWLIEAAAAVSTSHV